MTMGYTSLTKYTHEDDLWLLYRGVNCRVLCRGTQRRPGARFSAQALCEPLVWYIVATADGEKSVLPIHFKLGWVKYPFSSVNAHFIWACKTNMPMALMREVMAAPGFINLVGKEAGWKGGYVRIPKIQEEINRLHAMVTVRKLENNG